MNRVSLAAVAAIALIGAAACKDAVTSPQNSSDLALRYGVSNPPPPPIDTGANGSFSPTQTLRADPTPKFLAPRYTIVQSPAPTRRLSVLGAPNGPVRDFTQSSFFFSVPIRYLFNPTMNSGYVHFTNDLNEDVTTSSNGMVKNNHGTVSGKGTLTIVTIDGTLVINLASIQVPPSTLGCAPPSTDAPTGTGPACFFFRFTDATLNGQPGSVTMNPGCDPTDINNDQTEACNFFLLQ